MEMAALFKNAIVKSGKDAAPLLIGSEGRYSLEYVPFEHVNTEARFVIVGIHVRNVPARRRLRRDEAAAAPGTDR